MGSKYMFQLVSKETGQRSEPFVATYDDVFRVIEESDLEYEDIKNDYLLQLVMFCDDQTAVSQAPLITVEHFRNTMRMFNNGEDRPAAEHGECPTAL